MAYPRQDSPLMAEESGKETEQVVTSQDARIRALSPMQEGDQLTAPHAFMSMEGIEHEEQVA